MQIKSKNFFFWMDIQDLFVLVALAVLIAYDVIDFIKFRQEMNTYNNKSKEKSLREIYPQNNMKEYLPPARKYDKADVVTTTHRYYPKNK